MYNALAIVASLLVCVERPRKRSAERAATNEPVVMTLNGDACCLKDIPETGARVECRPDAAEREIGDSVRFSAETVGSIDGHVAWKRKIHGKVRYGVAFDHYSYENYRKLLRMIGERNEGYRENREKRK